MKQLIITILAIFVIGNIANAQSSTITKSVKVDGVCGQCKKRIENAAYLKGVKYAEWNKNTQILKVVYNNTKTTLEQIENNIAKTGHKAGTVKATNDNYKKLPDCCAYKEVHPH